MLFSYGPIVDLKFYCLCHVFLLVFVFQFVLDGVPLKDLDRLTFTHTNNHHV